MSDFLVFIGALLGTYVCALGFVVGMVKVFFPLKSKEEWEKIKILEGEEGHRQASRFRRVPQAVINQSRQLV